MDYTYIKLYLALSRGVARPGPTRACALPSTSQALPSPGQQDSRDSSMNTKKQTYTHACSANTILSHFHSISVTFEILGYAPELVIKYKSIRIEIKMLTRCTFKFSKWRRQCAYTRHTSSTVVITQVSFWI